MGIKGISGSGNTWNNSPLKYCIESLSRLGYDGVELMCDRPHVYPKDFDKKARKNLKESLDSLGLAISGFDAIHIASESTSRIEELKNYSEMARRLTGDEPSWASWLEKLRKIRIQYTEDVIDLAVDLEGDNVTTSSGKTLEPPEVAWKHWIEGLRECCRYGADRGVHVLINLSGGRNGAMAGTPDDMLKTIVDVGMPEWLGVNYDPGHNYVMGLPVRESVRKLGKHIWHTHVEDMRMGQHYHLPPGEGEVDLRSFIEELNALGYNGYLCLMMYNAFRDPNPAAEKGIRHIKKLLEST